MREKRLLRAFVITVAAGGLAGCASTHSGQTAGGGNSGALAGVQHAYVRFERATLRLKALGTSCQTAPAPTHCLADADVSYGHAISEFAAAVSAVHMPTATASAEARLLASAAARTGQDYSSLGISTTAKQFSALMTR